jgi:hypothetical protein
MDEWNPAREERIDAQWLRHETERLERQADECGAPDEHEELVNGSTRGDDGRFAVSSERVVRTAGTSVLPPGEYEELLLRIAEQIRRAKSLSPVLALDGAKEMRRLCDALEYEAVALARGCGWPWRDIGSALGISESGAHRRFAQDNKPRLVRRERC